MVTVDVPTVRQLAERILAGAGVPACHGETQVDLLLEAELRGVPSHGLLRLERIVRRIENGVTNPHATGVHAWRGPAFLAVDGGRGLGPVVATMALQALAESAQHHGIAVAAVTNSNHLGMLAWYTTRLARQGFSAIALSTSEALVHPWGARRAMIGTNPISIGVPTGGEPFVMDIATSLVSMGEIHDHAQKGAPIPPHWAIDAEGNPTTDPNAAKEGAIAPFGDAKGYALGLAFELLVSSLAGAALGRDVRGTLDDTEICNKGDLFILINGPNRDLTAYLQAIRDLQPAKGVDKVLIPGERGAACRAERLRQGVPLPDALWTKLQDLAGTRAVA